MKRDHKQIRLYSLDVILYCMC